METLRLFPPGKTEVLTLKIGFSCSSILFLTVPLIARQMKEDLKLASGDYIVPAGATVAVATFKLHRNETIYPNPTKFNPDNFLPERQANRHYYAFVPFSAGPRSCVGMCFHFCL